MKKRLPSFLAGMLTMALIGSLGVGALAASGAFTITVDPVNIQVNGQTFTPKDAKGNDVPVFSYNGTTYAPLRALAEAYGLNVGWDQGAQMATVGETATPATTPAPGTTASNDYSDWSTEDEAAYQEFKGMWDIETRADGLREQDKGTIYLVYATLNTSVTTATFKDAWNSMPNDTRAEYATRLVEEYYATLPPFVYSYYARLCDSDGREIATVQPPHKGGSLDGTFNFSSIDIP